MGRVEEWGFLVKIDYVWNEFIFNKEINRKNKINFKILIKYYERIYLNNIFFFSCKMYRILILFFIIFLIIKEVKRCIKWKDFLNIYYKV